MKHFHTLPAVLLLAGLLCTSCGSRRHAAATTADTTAPAASPAGEAPQTAQPAQQQQTCVTARLRIELSAGSGNTALGGTLRMKRDDVVQLSLVTFGILEVARIEMTADYVLLIDRIGKQFVKAAYADIDFMQGVDFQTIQAYFWDENVPSLSVWQRKDYVSVAGWSLPTRHVITIPLSRKTVSADLTLSGLAADCEWEKRTTVPAKYREVSASELMARIMNLTK